MNGFSGTMEIKASCESSLEVEIWEIYRGLTIILEKGMTGQSPTERSRMLML